MFTHRGCYRGLVPEAQGKSPLGLLERMRHHYARRAAREQLHGMEDRILDDIGITQSDVNRLT